MTRKSKSLSVEEENAIVQNYFEQVKEELTGAEFAALTEGYECLRQLVVPGNYGEVAMTLITVIYSRRKNNKGELVTLDKVLNDALEEPLFEDVLAEVSPERLRELNAEDALAEKKDDIDLALESTIELLLDSKDMNTDIFLDIAVRGKTVGEVAKKYHISENNVLVLYEAARESVKNIMVLDHDVELKDEPIKGTK
jgi:Mor family transcriptional regulator